MPRLDRRYSRRPDVPLAVRGAGDTPWVAHRLVSKLPRFLLACHGTVVDNTAASPTAPLHRPELALGTALSAYDHVTHVHTLGLGLWTALAACLATNKDVRRCTCIYTNCAIYMHVKCTRVHVLLNVRSSDSSTLLFD